MFIEEAAFERAFLSEAGKFNKKFWEQLISYFP
jgi:hypothetical protein